MQDTVTIIGNVATDPTQGRTAGGVPVANFRLASTHRRFDEATQTWVDVGTNWYSVAAFRHLAENVKASLRAGDSVIVTGRMKIRAWENNGKQGTSVDIDADAVGHDLRWGTTAYRRSPSRSSSADQDRGAADPAPSSATSSSEASEDARAIDTSRADPDLASAESASGDPGASGSAGDAWGAPS